MEGSGSGRLKNIPYGSGSATLIVGHYIIFNGHAIVPKEDPDPAGSVINGPHGSGSVIQL